jgi:hypothetical protein
MSSCVHVTLWTRCTTTNIPSLTRSTTRSASRTVIRHGLHRADAVCIAHGDSTRSASRSGSCRAGTRPKLASDDKPQRGPRRVRIRHQAVSQGQGQDPIRAVAAIGLQ